MELYVTGEVQRPDRPVVTVLTPVFNEQAGLAAYEREVTDVLLSRSDCEYRVLFIDDGSTDRSWEMIREICRRSTRFAGIRLSRNFGSHIALSAGFFNASGDAVATLACDLQDPPEAILEFVEAWRAGASVVWGHRRVRDEERWRVLSSKLFASLIRRYAMPKGSKFTTGSFLLVDRMVAECIRQFPERNRITFALVAWTGFDQHVVEYDRRRRQTGVSGWSYSRMISALYDTFIGFSFAPIRLMTLVGFSIFLLLIPYVLVVLVRWMEGVTPRGWTSLMVAVAALFGMQFLLLGVIGEYLYRIYSEVTRRPLYFVSDRTGKLPTLEAAVNAPQSGTVSD